MNQENVAEDKSRLKDALEKVNETQYGVLWKTEIEIVYETDSTQFYSILKGQRHVSEDYDDNPKFFSPSYFQVYLNKTASYGEGKNPIDVPTTLKDVVNTGTSFTRTNYIFYPDTSYLWNNVMIKSKIKIGTKGHGYIDFNQKPGEFIPNYLEHSIKLYSNDKESIDKVIDWIDSDARQPLKIQDKKEKHYQSLKGWLQSFTEGKIK